MIIQEHIDNMVRTYSDKNVYIHGGFPEADYIEAIDPVEAKREYVETDRPIPAEEELAEEQAKEQDYIKALKDLGVTVDEEE